MLCLEVFWFYFQLMNFSDPITHPPNLECLLWRILLYSLQIPYSRLIYPAPSC